VTDKTRLSAFEACLASVRERVCVHSLLRALHSGFLFLTTVMLWAWQHKVEASGQVHEYDVENVIHSTSQISPMHLQKPALVSE
jgi:hypothetical protein